MTKLKHYILYSLLGIFLGACSIHKIDIQQGNVITQESVAKLSLNMTKKQVSLILGTPLITDPFHENRWDYVYRFVEGDTGEVQDAHVTLVFSNDALSDIIVRKAPPLDADIKTPELIRR